METVLVTELTALVFAIPLGIWAARNKYVQHHHPFARPHADGLRLPRPLGPVLLHRGGARDVRHTHLRAPGCALTRLGIRWTETVEAGRSFGATDWQILRGIQLPLAVPHHYGGHQPGLMLAPVDGHHRAWSATAWEGGRQGTH